MSQPFQGPDPRYDNRPLPSGWEMRIDKATGWPFFIDHNNQITSWDDPRRAQQPMPQPANNMPGFREIPIQHEAPNNNQGFQQGMQSRQIPIQVEQGNGVSSGREAPKESYGWRINETPTVHQTTVHPAPQNASAESRYQSTSNVVHPPNTGHQQNSQSEAVPRQGRPAHFEAKPHVYAPPDSNGVAPNETGKDLQPPGQPSAREPSPVRPNMTPLQQVQLILKEANEIQEKVNVFQGQKGDKEYLYLEEMLTRKLLKLDNIMSDGNEEIRNTRRQAVKTVQSSLDQLELKAFANDTDDSAKNTNSHNNNGKHEAEGEEKKMQNPEMDSDPRGSAECSS